MSFNDLTKQSNPSVFICLPRALPSACSTSLLSVFTSTNQLCAIEWWNAAHSATVLCFCSHFPFILLPTVSQLTSVNNEFKAFLRYQLEPSHPYCTASNCVFEGTIDLQCICYWFLFRYSWKCKNAEHTNPHTRTQTHTIWRVCTATLVEDCSSRHLSFLQSLLPTSVLLFLILWFVDAKI